MLFNVDYEVVGKALQTPFKTALMKPVFSKYYLT